jgi:hypothetical protein
MQVNANFVMDNKGEKQFVMIPYLEWEKIQKLLNKMDALEGIKKGYIEVKKAKNSKKKLRTLSEFLSEC